MLEKINSGNPKLKILLVEDDPVERETVRQIICADYEAIMVDNGESAIEVAQSLSASLIIMDLDIPKLNGIEVCRRLRLSPLTKNLPIIVLTGTSDRDVRVTALDFGADDFVVKPFYDKELLSRIRARLRTHTPVNAQGAELSCGNLRLNFQRMEARARDSVTPLSPLECSLLAMFMKNPESVLSRESIMLKAWCDTTVSQRTVDTHVVSIRKAIGPSEYRIETVYGAGYMLTITPRKAGAKAAHA